MPTSTLVLVKKKTINCAYVIFDLSWWKIQYPKKIPPLFSRPKKIPASFIDPKKSLLAKMSDQKKSFGPPPSLKYVSGAPGTAILSWPIVRGLSSYTVQTHVRLDVAQPRSRGSLLLVMIMSQERRTLGPGKIGGSLRSKRFRASSSRTSGREKKKRNDGGGGGERRN